MAPPFRDRYLYRYRVAASSTAMPPTPTSLSHLPSTTSSPLSHKRQRQRSSGAAALLIFCTALAVLSVVDFDSSSSASDDSTGRSFVLPSGAQDSYEGTGIYRRLLTGGEEARKRDLHQRLMDRDLDIEERQQSQLSNRDISNPKRYLNQVREEFQASASINEEERLEIERLGLTYDELLPAPDGVSSLKTSLSPDYLAARQSHLSRPYNVTQSLHTLSHLRDLGFLLRYSSASDRFHLYIPASHPWDRAQANRARTVTRTFLPPLVRILRREFPRMFRRFTTKKDSKEDEGGIRQWGWGGHAGRERWGWHRFRTKWGRPVSRGFVVVLSAGDSPKVDCDCFGDGGIDGHGMDGGSGSGGSSGGRNDNAGSAETKETTSDSFSSRNTNGSSDSCNRYDFAPIWQFGSGFVHPQTLPSQVLLPIWKDVRCFDEFKFGNAGRVCDKFREAGEDNLKGVYFSKAADAMSDPSANRSFDNGGKEGGNEQQQEEAKEEAEAFSALSFNQLIPQIIWRGTDFSFLDCLGVLWRLEPKELARLVVKHAKEEAKARMHGDGSVTTDDDNFPAAMALAMTSGTIMTASSLTTPEDISKGFMSVYQNLTPRWKAVFLSHQSRLDGTAIIQADKMRASRAEDRNNPATQTSLHNSNHELPPILPWIDAKFTTKNRKGENQRWRAFLDIGVDVASFKGTVLAPKMDAKEQERYKYHLDLGGGGGTTWTGTYQKLALPGVLFHHETSTYDWYHEDLVPWEHYIPVKTDLSDLRERYDWAQSHVEEAFAISQRGTEFVRQMGQSAYWEQMYKRIFVERIGRTLDAYRPTDKGGGGESEKDFLNEARKMGVPLKRVGICTGWGVNSCKWTKDLREVKKDNHKKKRT